MCKNMEEAISTCFMLHGHRAVTRIDYPHEDECYSSEDTEWLVPPDDGDPGVLAAKSNAKPLCQQS